MSIPTDLTQLNQDVIAALEKNGIKDPAVVVSFTEATQKYKQVFWVSNVSRQNAITLLKALLLKMISNLN